MLTPGQEINPQALRAIRIALRGVVRGGVESPRANNALDLCELVLARAGFALVSGRDDLAAPYSPDDARRLRRCDPGELAALARIARREADRVAAREETFGGFANAPVTTAREPRADLETVRAYFHERFRDSGLHVLESEIVPGGRSKLTVFVTLAPNSRWPDRLVLRIDKPSSGQGTSVLDEYPVLSALHAAETACVPRPLWLEAGSEGLGAPFYAMSRLDGRPPGTLWSPGSASRTLAVALAEALAQLHAADPRAIWSAVPASARASALDLIEEYEAIWRAADEMCSLPMACAFAWLRQALPRVTGAAVPIHGDVHFANVLSNGDTLVGLTDWEFARAGHPAEDLAFCRTAIEQLMPWQEFLGHYRAFGGRAVSEDELKFFTITGYLRSAVFAARALKNLLAGTAHDLETTSIALHTRARVEALLIEGVVDAVSGP